MRNTGESWVILCLNCLDLVEMSEADSCLIWQISRPGPLSGSSLTIPDSYHKTESYGARIIGGDA